MTVNLQKEFITPTRMHFPRHLPTDQSMFQK